MKQEFIWEFKIQNKTGKSFYKECSSDNDINPVFKGHREMIKHDGINPVFKGHREMIKHGQGGFH